MKMQYEKEWSFLVFKHNLWSMAYLCLKSFSCSSLHYHRHQIYVNITGSTPLTAHSTLCSKWYYTVFLEKHKDLLNFIIMELYTPCLQIILQKKKNTHTKFDEKWHSHWFIEKVHFHKKKKKQIWSFCYNWLIWRKKMI